MRYWRKLKKILFYSTMLFLIKDIFLGCFLAIGNSVIDYQLCRNFVH